MLSFSFLMIYDIVVIVILHFLSTWCADRLPVAVAAADKVGYYTYDNADCSGMPHYQTTSAGSCIQQGVGGMATKAVCSEAVVTPTAPPTGSPGFITITIYADEACASSVTSFTVYALNACVKQEDSSYMISNYQPFTQQDQAFIQLITSNYSDTACSKVATSEAISFPSSGCSYGSRFAYSTTTPSMPQGQGVIEA